jgi:hypothetical protein
VTAAPSSHRVIFENALVRVLEVTMPPPAKRSPCIIIVGLASFWTGIQVGSHHIFATTSRRIRSETSRARPRGRTLVTGRYIG